MNIYRIPFGIFLLCAVYTVQTEIQDIELIDELALKDSGAERAIQTLLLNNLLILNNAEIMGNVTVEGSIIGTIDPAPMCGLITSTPPTTPHAIARFADTTGNSLLNSGVLIDATGNISGIMQLNGGDTEINEQITIGGPLITQAVTCHPSIEAPDLVDNDTFTAAATTSALIILHSMGSLDNITITFPPSPQNGQTLNIINGEASDITNITLTASSPIINPITSLIAANEQSASYIYYSATNTWYKTGR